MKKTLGLAVIFLVILAITGVSASLLVPRIYNWIFTPTSQDLSFLDVSINVGTPEKKWELLLPWSRDGLGGADKYLGEVGPGMPVGGGVTTPWATIVNPHASLIAVEDWGPARFYDFKGHQVGICVGIPEGFLPDGGIVTSGGGKTRKLLAAYNLAGEMLWERDPFKDVLDHLALKYLSFIHGHFEFFTTPDGYIFAPMWAEYGKTVPHELPDESPSAPPGATIKTKLWQVEKRIETIVVYDKYGNRINILSEKIPRLSRFTPHGSIYGTAIQQDNHFVHREFTLNKSEFKFKRNLYMPSVCIDAAARNGSYLCFDGLIGEDEMDSLYTVYQEGRSSAVRFTTPRGHWIVGSSFEGLFFTAKMCEDGLLISCWKWPLPTK